MDQFLEIFFEHDRAKARLEVDGSHPGHVILVATPDALAHLAGLACDFVLHFRPEELAYSVGGEPGLSGPKVLRLEFDASLDEPDLTRPVTQRPIAERAVLDEG